MKIGYGKIGRAWKLDPLNGNVGAGDLDVAMTLRRLAEARPDDQFYLVGRNDGTVPADAGYPSNVINPWTDLRASIKRGRKDIPTPSNMPVESAIKMQRLLFEGVWPWFAECDELIMWTGQHGTSNSALPMIGGTGGLTNPQDAFVYYCGFLLTAINTWRDQDPTREEVWLCPDPRNYIKCRDLKHPVTKSVISQFDQTRATKHERYGDQTEPTAPDRWDPKGGGVWVHDTRYTYDSLELTMIHEPQPIPFWRDPWAHRQVPLGLIINENRAYVAKDRLSAMKDWVLPHWPDAPILGNWSDKSKEALNRPDIAPVPYDQMAARLSSWFSTLTTPASGSGWATGKPWEAFRLGTVCFFHPQYDTQDNILGDADPDLRAWLRVATPEELVAKVNAVVTDEATWEWLVTKQYTHYINRFEATQGGIREIMRRLDHA